MLDEPRQPQTLYAVPRRFGISTIFVATTLFAIVFGVLRYFEATWRVFVFVFLQLSLVSILQFWLTKVPRFASVLAGVLFVLALSSWSAVDFHPPHGLPIEVWLPALLITSVFGAIFGYVTGVLIGAVFLVSDKLPPLLRRIQKRKVD